MENTNKKNNKDNFDSSLLHQAIESEQGVAVISALLQFGADVNAKDTFDNTPLHLAVRLASAELVALLLEHGADVQAKDRIGDTPLHTVVVLNAKGDKKTIINHLLNYGADIFRPGDENLTPLDLAIFSPSQYMTQMFIAHSLFNNPFMVQFDMNAREVTLWNRLLNELNGMRETKLNKNYSLHDFCMQKDQDCLALICAKAGLTDSIKRESEKFPNFTFHINAHLKKGLLAKDKKNQAIHYAFKTLQFKHSAGEKREDFYFFEPVWLRIFEYCTENQLKNLAFPFFFKPTSVTSESIMAENNAEQALSSFSALNIS